MDQSEEWKTEMIEENDRIFLIFSFVSVDNWDCVLFWKQMELVTIGSGVAPVLL